MAQELKKNSSRFNLQNILFVVIFLSLFSPFIAEAKSIKDIIQVFIDILGLIVKLLWLLAFVVFIWGIVKFIAAAGNPAKKESARNYIIYGLIGVFVLLSFMGIIKIVGETFGIPTENPSIPTQQNNNNNSLPIQT